MGMSLKDSPAGFDPTQHQNYNASDEDFSDADAN
jgi:DNA-directed RNA polymerase subunit alpha